MKVVTKEEQTVTVLVDIICNKCGNSCMRKFDQFSKPPGEHYGTTVMYTPGYLSTEFSDDGCTHSVDICEKCIFEFFKTCKVPPGVD